MSAGPSKAGNERPSNVEFTEMPANTVVPSGFKSYSEFYLFYLAEHRTRTCKILHFFGAAAVLTTLALIALLGAWKYFWILPVFGYAPAWIGHFVFENNRPASFKWPAYSLLSDFVLFWHLLTGKLAFRTNAPFKG